MDLEMSCQIISREKEIVLKILTSRISAIFKINFEVNCFLTIFVIF